MEIPAVAGLIKRASSICGLAVVLDADLFLETLKRIAPQADLRGAQITYVSLRIPSSCRVGYRVDVAGTILDLDVRAGRPEDVAEWRCANLPESIPGPLGPGRILLENDAILVNVFPNDPKLKEIRHLMDGADIRQVLRDLFPTRPDFWESEFRTMRYRPERRLVGEVRGADGARAVVKTCTHRAYVRSKRNAMAFQPDGPLRIAKLLGSCDSRRLLAYEWIPGRSLFELYSDPEVDTWPLAVAGAALATMHAQRPEGLSHWTRDSEVAHLRGVAEEIGFVCPELSGRARAIARRLEERLPDAPATAAIHGDISARHILVEENSAGIIDLDWACYGDPADDLGYLVATVERSAVRGKTPPGRVEKVREAMLDGYGQEDDAGLSRRIDLYTGVGLFQQARFPFRSWTPDWPHGTEALLRRTEDYVKELS